mmetsp:Transcript_54538/g.130094  ORF Transcript_54538/g.130094 Transcript_54538/m.130094 type:complete len:360 (-) Transcript_54538:104-1183(-)
MAVCSSSTASADQNLLLFAGLSSLEPWLLRLPLPVAYRALAFLSRDEMAWLLLTSPAIWKELREACWALCRPSVAQRRLEKASSALQKWLEGVPRHVPPPRKAGQLSQVRTSLSDSALSCRACEQAVRGLLHQGLHPLSHACCKHKSQDVEAAALLRPLLSDESADVRRVAATCLGCLGSAVHDAAVTALAKRVQEDSSKDVRLAAVNAMGALGPVAARHAHAVALALRDTCQHVSAMAGQALPLLGAEPAAELCVQLLQDDDRFVRARALAVLGRLGRGASPHIRAVAAKMDDAEDNVRTVARSALMSIQRPVSARGVLLAPSETAMAVQAMDPQRPRLVHSLGETSAPPPAKRSRWS